MPRFPVRWRRSLPVPLEPGDCKEYLRLDRPENTTKSRRRRRERMPPSVAVSFVEQAPCDGLSERETVLLSKFEHGRTASSRFVWPVAVGAAWTAASSASERRYASNGMQIGRASCRERSEISLVAA